MSTVLSEMSTVTTQLRADIRSFQTAAYRPPQKLLDLLNNFKGARDAVQSSNGLDKLQAISQGPQSWLRNQAVGILNLCKVEVSAPQQGPPIKAVQHKPYYMSAEYVPAWEIGRGWDSAWGNPRPRRWRTHTRTRRTP